MAVVKMPQSGKMILKVQTGVNAAGNPVFRLRTFNNIKASAADADVFAVAQGLAGLQKHTLVDTVRQDLNSLVNQ
ncbi:DUF1659 domain-containing protein [Sporomusa acidovorans]|uniref:DUF1659 domain-containing protein n=1 Tax=Sporomusa acidovorans (strain ATCC 49682 / DSM 3132 / Mol) TaxID=1123286 RepID=A0ABZ3J7P7_SPOA4|nr:DUF1659 domain-containing protein [Sporomusa acidovorans]OZC19400.1 hypothetical protein SPACI_29900 [Sporomusa acidovorans DSM 3132]SDD77995.1 Protein of unknown function [Sporomusa acidovorans]